MTKRRISNQTGRFLILLVFELHSLALTLLSCAQDPENAEAHFRRAGKLFEEGKLEGAEREYRLALKLAPRAAQGYNNLGVLYFSKRDFEQAVTAFKQAQSLRPEDAEINFNLGLALFQTGDCKQAISYLEVGETSKGHAPDAHYLNSPEGAERQFNGQSPSKAIMVRPEWLLEPVLAAALVLNSLLHDIS
jgi:tetratricopeptide (TPR) repeat protein